MGNHREDTEVDHSVLTVKHATKPSNTHHQQNQHQYKQLTQRHPWRPGRLNPGYMSAPNQTPERAIDRTAEPGFVGGSSLVSVAAPEAPGFPLTPGAAAL